MKEERTEEVETTAERGQAVERGWTSTREAPETYRLRIPVSGVFYGGGPMGTRIPLSGKGLRHYPLQIQAFLHEIGGPEEGTGTPADNGRLLEEGLVPEIREKIDWTDVSVSREGSTLYGWIQIQTKAHLSEEELQTLSAYVEGRFSEGWGEHFSDSRIAVAGGILRFWFRPPGDCTFTLQKKYKITELSHPRYPWLHRIQALKTVNEWIGAGDLGGYVQSERNLSQEGECWIYDDAVCCGEALVCQDAELCDGAAATGSAVVSGDARMYDRAWAVGSSRIESGEVKDDAVVAGEAVIQKDGKGFSPLIAGNSQIYGRVCGRYIIKDTIFPGETYQNPTEDVLIMENGKRNVRMEEKKFRPPENFQETVRRKNGMER